MNIFRLAKHLKEFTLDEINMIAECNCETELEQLLNSNKLVFERGLYKIVTKETFENFEVQIIPTNKITPIKVENAIKYFMENYVQKYCRFETYRNYNSIFKFNILPFFKDKFLNDIGAGDIKYIYEMCKMRGLKPRRIKNTMALLNQLIKYFQRLGIIDRTCVFQVRRLSNKNKFTQDRIIFEE